MEDWNRSHATEEVVDTDRVLSSLSTSRLTNSLADEISASLCQDCAVKQQQKRGNCGVFDRSLSDSVLSLVGQERGGEEMSVDDDADVRDLGGVDWRDGGKKAANRGDRKMRVLGYQDFSTMGFLHKSNLSREQISKLSPSFLAFMLNY
ncbi:unnamed protein product, partial [Notodromas monacha]